jgi:hypothetical protein
MAGAAGPEVPPNPLFFAKPVLALRATKGTPKLSFLGGRKIQGEALRMIGTIIPTGGGGRDGNLTEL